MFIVPAFALKLFNRRANGPTRSVAGLIGKLSGRARPAGYSTHAAQRGGAHRSSAARRGGRHHRLLPSRSCGSTTTHHPADLYISWRVSHFRHYHSRRGSARARHTRLAVPFCRRSREDRKSRRVARSPPRVNTRVYVFPPRGSQPSASPRAIRTSPRVAHSPF